MTKSDIIDYLKTKDEISHKVFIMEIHFFIEKDNKEYKFMVVRRNEKLVSLFHTHLKIRGQRRCRSNPEPTAGPHPDPGTSGMHAGQAWNSRLSAGRSGSV